MLPLLSFHRFEVGIAPMKNDPSPDQLSEFGTKKHI